MIDIIKQENININLYYIALPESIHGMVQKDSDGQYKIILNANETAEQNYISFLHEVTHIYRKDLDKGGDVQKIEWQTHDQLVKALKEIQND